jgi:protein-tyrosine phosphatase
VHPKELRHYDNPDLGSPDLLEFYRQQGFEVRHIPWEDPAHRQDLGAVSYQEELCRVRLKALRAFDNLPKPVLLHCSAGIDHSTPVAAYIFVQKLIG